MRTLRPGANYLSGPPKIRSKRAHKSAWISSLVATLVVAGLVLLGVGVSPSLAFADEDSFDSSELESTFADADPTELNEYLDEFRNGASQDTFQYVLGRLMIPTYINYAPDAVVASNAASQAGRIGFSPDGGLGSNNYLCAANQVGAGTPIYHNCDVPNFSGEFVQNLYTVFDRSGPQNAFALNATSLLFPSFGQSKNLPTDGVPIETAGAANKYTGLEVFGYDLQLSSYYGEWDHIQTLTQSRLLTNYSFFDSINLTAQSIGDAIGGAFNQAGSMSAAGWNSGGIFGAIGGYFSGLFQGGASAAMNTLLDTSDSNVVLTFGWYRANYAETAYGLRELTNQEIAAQIRSGFLSYMNATMPEDRTYDEWLKTTAPSSGLMNTPPEPAIANCTVYSTPGGGEVVHGTAEDAAPGITADQCDALKLAADQKWFQDNYAGVWSSGDSFSTNAIVYSGGSYYQARRSISDSTTSPSSDTNFTNVSGKIKGSGASRGFDLGAPDKGDGRGGWDEDGARPAQSFNEWLANVKSVAGNWDASISEYGISLSSDSCNPSNADAHDTAQAKAAYTSWLSNCWSPQWSEAAVQSETANQTEQNTTWLTNILTGSVLAKWAANHEDAFSFNSPWSRYVCVNEDGSDVTNGVWSDSLSGGDTNAARLVSAFNKNGETNPLCPQAEYRAPIQGGLFGDGYNRDAPNQNPAVDTRHISNFMGPAISLIQPFLLQPMHSGAQVMFAIGQFATQASNEIITWTYMPILESLGISDLVTQFIESLREGIFFPMAALLVAAAGLDILYQAGVKRKYRDMFASAIYMALIFIVGAALMARPDAVVTLVDKVPANIEKATLSLILGPTIGEDKICTTSSSASATGTGEANWDDLDITAESDAGGFTDIFGDGYSAADDPLREVLCANWKAFVYYPWVFAQWGTAPGNLDADAMSNTNQDLVGDASVDLGGANGVVNNWATYQLKAMKVGSGTTVDWNLTNIQLKNKDFYKLVDLQAGPNGGAASDASYLNSWSGMDPLGRVAVGGVSMILAILGLVVVAAYSITKILITVVSVMMLIFLPIVFLFGLFPTKRKVVRDYLLTILSMGIQRVALMLMIGIFLLLLITIISSSTNYVSSALGAVIMCIIFLKFRGPVVKFALGSAGVAGSAFGNMASKATGFATGLAGVDGREGAGKAWGQVGSTVGEYTPNTLKNYGYRVGAGVKNMAAGALSTVMVGGNAWENANAYALRRDVGELNKNFKRRGWRGIEHYARTKEQIEGQYLQRADKDVVVKDALAALQGELPIVAQYHEQLAKHKEDLARFNNDILEQRIEEVDEYSEAGVPVYGEDGMPERRYFELDRTLNESGELIITRGRQIQKPKAPEKPELESVKLNMDQLKLVKDFGKLSAQRKAAVERQETIKESIYASGSRSETLINLPAGYDDNQLKRVIEEAMPDSEGFTSISREKLGQLVKEHNQLSGEIISIDKSMDATSKRFQKAMDKAGYMENPNGAKKDIIEAIKEEGKAIESEMAEREKNGGDRG